MSVLKHPVGVNRNSPSGEKHNRRKKFGTVSSMKMEWLIWAFTLGEVAGALASAASVVLSLFGFSSVLASFFGVSSAATVAGDVMLAVLVAAALVLLGGSAFVSVVFVSVGLSASVVGVWVTSPSVDGVLVVAASAAVGVGSSGLVSSDLFWEADLSSASALFVLSAVSGFVVDAESLPTAALAVELALALLLSFESFDFFGFLGREDGLLAAVRRLMMDVHLTSVHLPLLSGPKISPLGFLLEE